VLEAVDNDVTVEVPVEEDEATTTEIELDVLVAYDELPP